MMCHLKISFNIRLFGRCKEGFKILYVEARVLLFESSQELATVIFVDKINDW